MKNALFVFITCAVGLFACQKNETVNPATTLVGTWSMRNIEPSTAPADDFFDPEFTYEIFTELFAEYAVEFTEKGRIQFIPISPETEPSEIYTLQYQEYPAQHIFQCFKEEDEEPMRFTYHIGEDGTLKVVTDDGVSMEFEQTLDHL